MRHLILPGLAAAAFAVLGLSAAAQPGRPGASVPDAQFQASVNQWASQLVLEAQHLRDALAAAGPRFADLHRQAERFYNSALAFYRVARGNPGRERLRRDYQPVDRDLDALVAAVRGSIGAERNVAV